MSVKKIRIFLDKPFTQGKTLSLSQAQTHYLRTVMRMPSGSQVHLFNGQDGEWLGTLQQVSKKSYGVTLENPLVEQPTFPFLGLVFPPIRQARLDFMIEKATELGVTDFYPVRTDHTAIPRINEERLRRIAIEAAEQSERLTIPTFHPLCALRDYLTEKEHQNISLHVAVERHLPAQTSQWEPPEKASEISSRAVLVGPEGGFSTSEIASFEEFQFIKKVGLGNHILRTETAAMVLLGLVVCNRVD